MQISFHDKSPIYRQLAERLRAMILEGVFQNGDALPSVRRIASEHRINPITVSKAYQILVDDGLVEKKRGLGMYVGEGAREQLLEDERRVFIDFELPEFRNRAQRLGFTLKDLWQEEL
ncbi:MAG: GntR family transcriptional regulator [Gammaproteobacteria bacterium]|nr:GntR family transcriptional regulator [Gammaproteobacteria bacterium]MBT5155342.1 GntR family transcriptional regulator [Gammaproteobacteria bacterium]MBT5684940.1 GntR family transcriptional regulator [Gammaproteobacteria bacterium]MBT5723625.1 GntR family transcriptional regulator [Gammaproteobacteria bacterium]MBT6585032.1 GntR family transcriptional regulator [Gammaproteobacteria bacterium]